MKHETIAIVKKPAAPVTSWWADFARPDQREHFIEAAKTRTVERTKIEDVREGKKNQAMRHVILPSQFPPKTRRG